MTTAMNCIKLTPAVIIATFMFACCNNKPATYDDPHQSVVANAKSYMSTPYKWGGTNTDGIDCSALVQNAFRNAGYEIPRTCREQYNYISTYTSLETCQAGDLIFFKQHSRIDHIGIVTSNNNGEVYFVHSSESLGGVNETKLDGKWRNMFYSIKRILPD